MALDPYETEDHSLFGKVLLRWGYIEIALVNIILRLTHPLFGLPDHDGVPYPFTWKIKLAKRGYSEIAEMAPLRGEAVQALGALRPLNAMRNIVVHGYYQGFTGSDRYLFGLYERRGGRKGAFTFHGFSAAELATLTADIEANRKRLDTLSTRTFQVPFPVKTR